MEQWTALAALAGFTGGLFTVFIYATGAPWWERETGRNFMAVTAVVTALFGLRVLALVFGDGYPGQGWLRAILFTAAAALLWWRARIVYKIQIRERRDGEPGGT